MPYPNSPWSLQGYGFQTLQPIDIDRVASFIPPELSIVSVLPGKTLGGIYIAAYTEGSTLLYSELIVSSALVRCGDKVGTWISHIYVDHPDSVAGGREIWGLPKELAEFIWEPNNALSVQVRQADRSLCRLDCKWQMPGWQQPVTALVYSVLDRNLMQFEGKGNFKLHLANIDLYVPPESPFASLDVGRPWLGFYCNPLSLTACTPSLVAERQPANV